MPDHDCVLYTFAVNRPDFLPLQVACFRRFLAERARFVVFNNGSEESARHANERACEGLDVELAPGTAQGAREPSERHARAIEAACALMARQPEPLGAIVDSDLFLLAPLSLRGLLDGHAIAARKDRRRHVRYLAPAGVMVFDIAAVPNIDTLDFSPEVVDGVGTDVGGALHRYLRIHPEIGVRDLPYSGHIHRRNRNLAVLPASVRDSYEDGFFMEVFARTFLHFAGGTNWNRAPAAVLARKEVFFDALVRARLAGETDWPGSAHAHHATDLWSTRSYPAHTTPFTKVFPDGRVRETGGPHRDVIKRVALHPVLQRKLPRLARWVRGGYF